MVRLMSLYDAVADLPLEVDSYELERRELAVSPEFTRVTTLVRLHGGKEESIAGGCVGTMAVDTSRDRDEGHGHEPPTDSGV